MGLLDITMQALGDKTMKALEQLCAQCRPARRIQVEPGSFFCKRCKKRYNDWIHRFIEGRDEKDITSCSGGSSGEVEETHTFCSSHAIYLPNIQ